MHEVRIFRSTFPNPRPSLFKRSRIPGKCNIQCDRSLASISRLSVKYHPDTTEENK